MILSDLEPDKKPMSLGDPSGGFTICQGELPTSNLLC